MVGSSSLALAQQVPANLHTLNDDAASELTTHIPGSEGDSVACNPTPLD
jgi:hypothetical protein